MPLIEERSPDRLREVYRGLHWMDDCPEPVEMSDWLLRETPGSIEPELPTPAETLEGGNPFAGMGGAS